MTSNMIVRGVTLFDRYVANLAILIIRIAFAAYHLSGAEATVQAKGPLVMPNKIENQIQISHEFGDDGIMADDFESTSRRATLKRFAFDLNRMGIHRAIFV